MQRNSNKYLSVSMMAKISLFSVMAFILMQIEFPVPLFPGFLKIDLSDLPALIAGLALGPIAGVLIELFKNLMHLLQTSTQGVGELANFIVGSALVLPAGYIYKKNKTKKSAIIGLIVGTFSMGIFGTLANYFIIIPFYSKVMMLPIETIVKMGTVVNAHIVDLKTLLLFGVFPFNIFKGIILSVITLIVYKKISRILN